MGNKKAALFVGGFIFFLVPFSGVRDFGEPPMGYVVRGYERQDDGNKGDYDEIEHWEMDAGKLRISAMPVNLQFLKFSGISLRNM
jgi:hypothetical protein